MALAALVGGKGSAEAATMSPVPSAAIAQTATDASGLVQQVHYYRGGFCYRHPYNWRCRGYHGGYRHCRRWRWECANRWGWHTPRFYRCLRYHGC